MRAAAAGLVLLAACTTAPPPAPAPAVDEQTRAAIQQLTEAVASQPANMPWIYVLATYHGRAHDAGGVVKWLTRLDELGWTHGVPDYDFRGVDTPAFRSIAAKLNAREPRVNRARPAFTLANQRDLVPEGIAHDPVEDVFYVTGIHRRKVLRVDRNGNAREFVAEAQDGMLGGLGVKVDAGRRLLWVISSTTEEMRGFVEGENRSMLAAYSLEDGRLVKKIDAAPALLNDLTLLSDGSLFATDMGRHKIVRLAPGAETLEIFAEDFRWPNGIAVSDDEQVLYVADFRGITRIDLRDNARTKIESAALLNGIDGLSFDRGTLIGIQNAIGRPRVIRLDLAGGGVEVLEAKNPLFELPTTGVVVGNDYWFIANPGLRKFNVADPVMLRLPLS